MAVSALDIKPDASLIYAEYSQNEAGDQLQNLRRIDFNQGRVLANELLLSSRTRDLRYDIFTNHIFMNRYLVTGGGRVIDLMEKRVVHQPAFEDLEVLGLWRSRVMMRRSNGRNLYEVHFYDLQTRETGLIKSASRWSLPGVVAPNGKRSVSISGRELLLHELNGRVTSLGTDFRSPQVSLSSFSEKPPVLWLNNQTILTQVDHGAMVIVDLKGHLTPAFEFPVPQADDSMIRIPGEPLGSPSRGLVGNPHLYRDIEGTIHYAAGLLDYTLDLQAKSATPRSRIPSLHGFDLLFTEQPCVVRYLRAEIGRCPVQYDPFTTASGYFASNNLEGVNTSRRVTGIKLWDAHSRRWQVISVDWLTTIIGWIEH